MKMAHKHQAHRLWSLIAALVFLAGCDDIASRDDILGTAAGATAPPTVTAVTPPNNAAGVSPIDPGISATLSEPVGPITGSASFTVTCDAPCADPAGTVLLDASNRVATFALAAGTELEGDTTYTVTMTGAESLETGLALVEPTSWSFTTAARPVVTTFTPADSAAGVSPVDPGVSATLSEPVGPISGSASFTLTCDDPCADPAGTVSLDASNTIATFALAAGTELEGATVYTATMTGAASLETGLTLAAPTSWSFTTAARPIVTTFTPANSAAGVSPVDPGISATLSEPVGPISGSASFTMTCDAPCANPAGTVSLDASNTIAIFALAAGTELQGATTYTATMTGAASLETGLALAEPTSWSFTTAARPRVTAVAPVANATGVLVNSTVITANFTEPVASLTGDASFAVTCEAPCTGPAGTVSLDVTNGIATYTLAAGTILEPSTLYTVTVTAAESLGTGLEMASPFVWSFTTAARPVVTTFTPANSAAGVSPVDPGISATLSEPVGPISGSASFTVTCDAPCADPAGTVSLDASNTIATYALAAGTELEGNTTYTVTMAGAASLETGLALAEPTIWSFTTTARPVVTTFTPADSAAGVSPVDPGISATLSEPVGPITGSASFTVTCDAPCADPAGTVSLDASNTIATFALAADTELEGNTTYTVTMTGAESLETGLALAEPTSWSFTTAARPVVTTFTPADSAAGVSPVDPGITATLSEPVGPITGSASFTVTCDAPCADPAGTVSLDASNTIATFALAAGTELEGDTTYTVTMTGAESLETGLALAEPTSWSFTAAARPVVTTFTPADSAIGVSPVDPDISATLSEPVGPITGSASFTVTCDAPCANPAGTVSLDASNTVATFALAAGTELEGNTTYTMTMTGAASLETGLALAEPTSWSFTTTARPVVTTFTPADSAAGVSPVDPGITATLSEPVGPITGSASFTVTCDAPCADPTGTVSLDASNTIATFALAVGTELQEDTIYTATISGAESLATGFAMAEPTSWSFTTAARPRVTAVAPADGATGVPVNNTVITADFTEAVAPLTGSASFTVTCQAPCTNPAGTVALDVTNEVATFTLAGGTTLEPSTLYTATVTAAESLETGLEMANPFVWSFTTGLVPDTTRPRVNATVPQTTSPGPTPDVPVNTNITARFTENMAPLTITSAGTFTLTCAAPCSSPNGTVSYAVGSRTAKFSLTPAGSELEPGTTYTATVTSFAKDLAGNALAGNQAPLPAASNYIWTFTTVSDIAIPPADITVTSVTPADADIGVCPNSSINATFDVSSGLQMDPATINSLTFTVAEAGNPGNTVTAASVVLDGANDIATFTPQNDLVNGTEYTATVKGGVNGVKDLAVPANIMIDDFVWSFTAGPATGECLQPVSLNTAVPFGMLAGTAGMTNQGILTIANGDLGSTTTATGSITGFRDTNGDVYTVTGSNDGTVNGTIFSCTTSTTGPTSAIVNAANCNAATVARNDAIDAFNELAGLPGGPDPISGSGPGNLANEVLAPGVYTSASGSFKIEGGDLTLDAQGDSNAVWVFQMATSLTVGGPGAAFPQSIILVNGAQARNVFWQVGSSATINEAGGGTMVGTIIASAGVSFSTAGNVNIVTLNGRAMSLNASVTVVNGIINVPAP